MRVEHGPLHDPAKAAPEETIQLAANDKLVGLVTSRERILLRQLDTTNSPKFSRILDQVDGTVATVTIADLANALKRAQIPGEKAVVTVAITHNTMTITTESEDGDNVDTLAVDYTGPGSEFEINPTYLAAATSAVGTDQAALTVPPAPRKPVRLTPIDDDGTPDTTHTQIVMVKRPAQSHST